MRDQHMLKKIHEIISKEDISKEAKTQLNKIALATVIRRDSVLDDFTD